MQVAYTPLLAKQRELQGMPRGMERFREYLRVMTYRDGHDVEFPPLALVNPMAKDHVTALLDQLLALDADAVAAAAMAAAAAECPEFDGVVRAAAVVSDDRLGGWTNRYAFEYEQRLKWEPRGKRFWATAVLWSSEPASVRTVRAIARAAVFRAAYVARHGLAADLRAALAQEGDVLLRAGFDGPVLEADELSFTREVIGKRLDASDMQTLVECLFGDVAARSLGFQPHGLEPWAGLALALADARAAQRG